MSDFDNLARDSAEKALKKRKEGIERCIAWVEQYGRNSQGAFPYIMDLDRISFETTLAPPTEELSSQTSYRPPMVGVFAKQKIHKDNVVLTIPKECVFDERSPLLEDLTSKIVDKSMELYRGNITKCKDLYSPWDPFHKSQGRIFCEDELRLVLHLTVLFYAQKHRCPGDEAELPSKLQNASDHWRYYFDTLPNDSYESLIFGWTDLELKNLEGTSCHAHAVRLRKEVKENWDNSFRDCLVQYLQQEYVSLDKEIDLVLLESCYKHAISTLYSRMHGLFEVIAGKTTSKNNTRCLCPLVDLINGDRDGSPRCNTHLLHYPGSHVALQAVRDIEAGEELIFSYGEIANLIFVAKFGFLPLSNTGNPQLHENDVVYLLPDPSQVWTESDKRWQALTNARDGRSLARSHLIEKSPFVTAQVGTPFAIMGNREHMKDMRVSETWRPPYLDNSHIYAMMSLTNEEDEDELIEEWEPGAVILEMIDFRLAMLPTNSFVEDKLLLASQKGNTKTGTLYRMLEREILHMWRHTVAKHYDAYGEPNSKGKGFSLPVISKGCATCQAELNGPLKSCTQCKAISYCSRQCQVEDWKSHKKSCRSTKR